MATQSEALNDIRAAAERFAETCAGCSDAEWRHRGAGEAWSIGDIAEHVTIANGNIMRRLATMLDKPLAGRQPDAADFEIPYLFYRGDEPPAVATPTGRFHNERSAFVAFNAGAAAIVDWTEKAHADLRRVGAPHPMFGLLDGVQWLLFVAAHLERHRSQIVWQLKVQRSQAG